jgi:uncharacterized SAM-binding protein YcdF (DUF218 family)
MRVKAIMPSGDNAGRSAAAPVPNALSAVRRLMPAADERLPFDMAGILPYLQHRVNSRVNATLSTTPMNDRVRALAETLWNYHHMNHELTRADAIFLLCSHDTAVARRGAELFLAGWAPLLIVSGGLGAITRQLWQVPEADQFAAIAIEMGVPRDRILIENRSANTGENVLFTKQLLADRGIELQRFILVQKPYMERRSYATFKRHWPEKDVVVTSPQVSFDEYLDGYSNRALSSDDVIAIIVGDLQRIRVYAAKGFQIAQDIPDDVWEAFEELVAAGYTRYLVPSP